MRSTLTRALAAAVILGGGIVADSSPASASSRSDLVPESASMRSAGSSLTGSFVVRSAWAASKRKTKASVVLVQGSRTIPIFTRWVKKIPRDRARPVHVNTATYGVPAGHYSVVYCVDSSRRIRERDEGNNCTDAGSVDLESTPGSVLCGGVNCAPLKAALNTSWRYSDATGTYWVHRPIDSRSRPFKVLIWLHGCGGNSAGDVFTPKDQFRYHYLTITPDGADGGCWSPSGSDARKNIWRVLRTRESVIAHFKVDPRQIVVGGYSSGGDLAYATAFRNSTLFAGVLAINTSPFRGTGYSSSQLLDSAIRRFPIYHLAHTGDRSYPLAGVQREIQQVRDAGFSVEYRELPGDHFNQPDTSWDYNSARPAGFCDRVNQWRGGTEDGGGRANYDGTICDVANYLAHDHMNLGWAVP